MNDNLLCKNLSMSIWYDPGPDFDTIKIRLVSKALLKKVENAVEITVQPGATGPQASRSYRVQEAIVLAMRRVVSEAVKEGLISMPPGKSLPTITRARVGVRPITLSIPPDM